VHVDEGIVEESAFYSKYAEMLVYEGGVCNQMANFRIHEESRSKFVIVCQAADIDVIPIVRKGLWSRFSSIRFLDYSYRDLVLS
jgi:hypothetical protein